MARPVAVIAKVGLLEHRGKVRTKEGVFEVVRDGDGWYVVGGPAAEGSGKVRYDDEGELLEIERPGIAVSIHFRGELEHTTFTFGGRTYAVGTMDFGNISIKEGPRPVVSGHVTVSGARLVTVAPEMLPIERELAFGLALRSSAADDDYWDESHPFYELFKENTEESVLGEEARRGGGKKGAAPAGARPSGVDA